MFKSYLLIALRTMRRNFSYVFLNVFGLTISVASCLVIFLVVRNELGYDNFHAKANRTYRVTLHALDYNPSVSMGVVPALRNDFPELEHVSQVWYRERGLVNIGQQHLPAENFMFVDGEFTGIFDYHWLQGDPRTALAEPNTIVLTKSMARRFFGNKDPMGQVLNLDNHLDLKVTGLIDDVPANTSLPFGFLVSFESIRKDLEQHGVMREFYAIMGGNAFIVLPEHYPVAKLQSRMKDFIKKNWGADIARGAELPLQPLRDIHFDQRYLSNPASPTTSRTTYWALAAVAIFIIITACINFINLATAQATRRAREVGVRKVLGANRPQLIRQFLGETAFLVGISLVLGLIVAYVFMPQAVTWLGIQLDHTKLFSPTVLGMVSGIGLVIILLAGLYPAFVQSAFKPALSLKGSTGSSLQGLTLRKGLVFVQFAASQVLIVGTLVVARQMDFFQNQDLGFDKDAVITLEIPEDAKRQVLEQQLINDPGVKAVSLSSSAPSFNNAFGPFSVPEAGITEDDVTEIKFIDDHYIDMFGLHMLAGEKIRKQFAGDTTRQLVINETLMHKMGIQRPEDAIGKSFLAGGDRVYVTGVVADFQSESKHKKRRPCMLLYAPDRFFTASVKLQPHHMRETIARIDKLWSALFPNDLFGYEFIDDHIASLYKQEQKVYTAFRLFSMLAILIGCLGLYGLVAFSAVQRTREVGIRKVLGASVFNIVSLFAKEFVLLIGIAFLVAAPVAYYIMHTWLENFAYHVGINAPTFVAALLVSCVVAAVTIGYQSVKAAVANPLKNLKAE
ncbi:MAG TPA: ABC transporter permease [Chitinophaga sp.]|uniref:ABC transporter permease n=1 Tax=Chitinophaga sp. TaxID=1869181 RepID=UPI002DBE79D9|nr:ABC transporter permease [Chitinophaga sp.]HEU4553685.1 ABC transporter permease [Chitinophaga sp.]